MPHTIEHKIRVLNHPGTPPPSLSRTRVDSVPELRRDRSWVESPLSERSIPITSHHHKKKSSYDSGEETYGVESFERNLRYSPHEVDRQHFAVRTFGEKREDGGERESRNSVRFEEPPQSKEADGETGGRHGREEGEHLLPYSRHLDTTPIRIPRVKIGHSEEQQRHNRSPSWHSFNSSNSSSPHYSRQQATPSPKPAEFVNFPTNVPMKKIIRKSRLVSIHDGRPMGPFVETVHYEPMLAEAGEGGGGSSRSARRTTVGNDPELWSSSSSCSLSSNDERGVTEPMGRRREFGGERWRESTMEMGGMNLVERNPIYERGRH